MQPRTSEGSANSAARTTCWYHSGKSSSRRGLIALSAAGFDMARRLTRPTEMTSGHFALPLYSPVTLSIIEHMRMKLLLTISILAAALQLAPVAFSQGGGGRQRGGGGAGAQGAGGGMASMDNLTPEERSKLMNARPKAR